MSIKDDMPFLAKVYETATEEQRQEIRRILGMKCEHKYIPIINSGISQEMCSKCGEIKN